MIKFGGNYRKIWEKGKIEPKFIEHTRPDWKPKHPLNHKLPGANEDWSKEQWDSSGFPSSKLPTKIPSMLLEGNWDSLVSELKSEDKLSKYHETKLAEIKDWLLNGIPYKMEGPGTEPEKAKHHLNQLETEMAVDKLAQFCRLGHAAGPLHDWEDREDLKFVSTFARYQAADNSLRIILDHSHPKGRAFNEAIDPNVVKNLHIHVGQLREFIHNVLQCGNGAKMSKFDMTNGYKVIPVREEQYRLQVIRICGGLFVDLKLSIGDASACHYYSFFHTTVQEAMVFKRIETPRSLVTICIDDSSVVSPKSALHWAQDYGDTYKSVMIKIGAGTKKMDPARLKCFEMQTSGEVLGCWIDSESLTWSLSPINL